MGGLSVRSLKANDSWRRICDVGRPRPLLLKSLRFQDVKGLGSGEVPLHRSLTVLCGGNGVGKTTLLNACRLSINCESVNVETRGRHTAAKFALECSTKAAPDAVCRYEVGVNQAVDHTKAVVDCVYMDPSADVFRLREIIERDGSWRDLLELNGPRDLDPGEREELSFLCGRDYEACRLYEISEYSEDDEPFPYFEVSVGGQRYVFEEMGLGEASLFYMWWRLKRIREPTVLLLEEPESHVTSSSQLALMDFVATSCSKQVSCVVTTHSAEIISYVPRECVRLVIRDRNDVRVVSQPDDDMLRVTLGVIAKSPVLALVEDECARILTVALMRHYHPELWTRIDVFETGSENEVISVLKFFPERALPHGVLGILDGDQRESFDLNDRLARFAPKGYRHPIEFLPGSTCPEGFLRNSCSEAVGQVALILKCDRDRALAFFSSVQGKDDHDWLRELARQFGVSLERMVEVLLEVAVCDPVKNSECKETASRIAYHLR